MVENLEVYPVEKITDLFQHISGLKEIKAYRRDKVDLNYFSEYEYDMRDIKGQESAKRSLEIAAAGGHNVLLKGPPGAGKTLLARAFPSILPNLTWEEADRFVLLIIQPVPLELLVEEQNLGRVRYHSLTEALYFWMNLPNSLDLCWRHLGNP